MKEIIEFIILIRILEFLLKTFETKLFYFDFEITIAITLLLILIQNYLFY